MHPHTSALVDFDVAPPPESVLVFEGPGEQCVNITIRMDQILESEEDFFVVLFSQQQRVEVFQRLAQVVITDTQRKDINKLYRTFI